MLNLFIIILMLLMITMLIYLLNLNFIKKKINDREKNTPFECGFNPFSSSRLPFSIQFYLISIIFLIFDIEILIFLPLINSFMYNIIYMWMKMTFLFIIILLIGLYIEWNDGALNWLK